MTISASIPSSLLISTPRRTPASGTRRSTTCSVTGTSTSTGFRSEYWKRHGDRQVEDLADLLDPQHDVRALDAVGDLHAGNRRAVDPLLEEALERRAGLALHRQAEILGADLAEARVAIEAPQPAEERVVAEEAAEHVQHRGALVVDQRAEHAALAADVAEAVAERHRPLLARVDAHFRSWRSIDTNASSPF